MPLAVACRGFSCGRLAPPNPSGWAFLGLWAHSGPASEACPGSSFTRGSGLKPLPVQQAWIAHLSPRSSEDQQAIRRRATVSHRLRDLVRFPLTILSTACIICVRPYIRGLAYDLE